MQASTGANVTFYCPLWAHSYTNFYILCKRCCHLVQDAYLYKVYILMTVARGLFIIDARPDLHMCLMSRS